MKPAEFEEASYEAPLYNQLERGIREVYTPGRVLENQLGFDRGILIADLAVWQTLGYAAPPHGIALGYYAWPNLGAGSAPGALPRFRLNLFIQAKRSFFYLRKPRSLRVPGYSAPLWAFPVLDHQQRLLERLADVADRRAHVTYAAPAFHTRADLYEHTIRRTVVENSTFPPVSVLRGHEKWYYKRPGAVGIANPDPEVIEEPPFLERLSALADASPGPETEDNLFDQAARYVLAAVQDDSGYHDPAVARYMNDLQTLARLLERSALRSSLRSYAQVRLFTLEFGVTWLIYGSRV